MAGNLPNTRPVSANYGEDLENERPVEDPRREFDANSWNPLKSDVAYVARLSALLRIDVNFSAGAPVAAAVWGPEGAVVGQIAFTDHGTGDVTVDWTNTGVNGSGLVQAIRRVATDGTVRHLAPTATSVRVKLFDAVPAAEDVSFSVLVY